jgi:alcohol dehydrogenase (cytochrome c)
VVDLNVGGRRAGPDRASRNGFFYVLDRANGKLLAANPYVR